MVGLDKLVTNKVFSWQVNKDHKLFVFYHGKQVMIVKGIDAQNLAEDLQSASEKEQQSILARITGNFKRGNERLAKRSSKNQAL
ncbi:hypothetical protein [Enterococcus crotali]|uniref:hypothetical protein n=1 Tax=Enterococcus crotali TaxID=1453587 RepID=UPI00046FDA3F|nr:hypothetical protein [Enterococcus crotali]OTP47996.1 hypothetical protein A5881_003118 [Enterococcus termitis]